MDRVQRQFALMTAKIDVWKGYEPPDIKAREIIYDAHAGDSALEIPSHHEGSPPDYRMCGGKVRLEP